MNGTFSFLLVPSELWGFLEKWWGCDVIIDNVFHYTFASLTWPHRRISIISLFEGRLMNKEDIPSHVCLCTLRSPHGTGGWAVYLWEHRLERENTLHLQNFHSTLPFLRRGPRAENWRRGDHERPSSECRIGGPSKRHFSPLPITPVETIQRVPQVDASPLLPPSTHLGFRFSEMLDIPAVGKEFYYILVWESEEIVSSLASFLLPDTNTPCASPRRHRTKRSLSSPEPRITMTLLLYDSSTL